MKLKSKFISYNSNGSTVLIPTADANFSGVVRGNSVMGVMAELLKNDTTEEKMISELHERFNAADGVIESDVKKFLDALRSIGALDE